MNTQCEQIINRPHVVLLGAGASVAAIPNGDKNGNKISVMDGFIDKLGMSDIIRDIKLKTVSNNLEDIFSELSTRSDCAHILVKLEQKIYDYFSYFRIPDTPTVYDYLLLSLTSKDLVATFNWDPLLLQAYLRVQNITRNLPKLAFLHGNVHVGVCHEHKRVNVINKRCPICRRKLEPVKLLYPIKEKNYTDDPYIKYGWNLTKNYLKQAYMFTIFGYSAPKTDESAISLLQEAWGTSSERCLEEIEIIDIRDEEDLRDTWDGFIYSHHYSVHSKFFNSSLGSFPRYTCEATYDRLMNANFSDDSKGFKPNMTFEEIKEHLLINVPDYL